MSDARKAVEVLRNMGYKNAHLDMIEKTFDEHSLELSTITVKKIPSLSALVSKSKGYIFDCAKGSILAADPIVSGTCSCKETINVSTRLLVSVDADKEDEVKSILNQYGGCV